MTSPWFGQAMDGRTGIDGKFYRAHELFVELTDEANAYLASGAYVIEDVGKPDAMGAHWGTLRIRQEPPARIGALAGEVAHNVRAALDYLACRLVEKAGATPSTKTYFPIAPSHTKWKKRYEQDLKGALATDVASIEALRPWQGGDDDFYVVHQLDIEDKHRKLLTTLGNPSMAVTLPPEFQHPERPNTLVLAGATVARDGEKIQIPPPASEATYGWGNAQVMGLVVAPDVLQSMLTLNEFRRIVERIVQKVEPLVASVK